MSAAHLKPGYSFQLTPVWPPMFKSQLVCRGDVKPSHTAEILSEVRRASFEAEVVAERLQALRAGREAAAAEDRS